MSFRFSVPSLWSRAFALGLLATGPALAAEPAGASPELKQHASAQYEAGVAAYKAGRFNEAVELFLAADRLVPSAVLSFNVARGYEKLGDVPRALAHYRDYLRRDPSPPNAESVRQRITELEGELGKRGVQQVTVLSAPPGSDVNIDGKTVGTTPWTGELSPGEHAISVSRPGYVTERRTFQLSAERAAELSVALSPEAGAPSVPPVASPKTVEPKSVVLTPSPPQGQGEDANRRFGPWPWVAMAAGGATLGAAGVFELLRRSSEEDARSASSQIEYKDRLDATLGRQTAARALAVCGGAVALTGGILILLENSSSAPSAPTATVVYSPRGVLGSLQGRF